MPCRMCGGNIDMNDWAHITFGVLMRASEPDDESEDNEPLWTNVETEMPFLEGRFSAFIMFNKTTLYGETPDGNLDIKGASVSFNHDAESQMDCMFCNMKCLRDWCNRICDELEQVSRARIQKIVYNPEFCSPKSNEAEPAIYPEAAALCEGTAITCSNCGEPLVPGHDESLPDRFFCNSCGEAYFHCQRCAADVPESEWREDVLMCQNCWDETVGSLDG